jgi:hypothetical protein
MITSVAISSDRKRLTAALAPSPAAAAGGKGTGRLLTWELGVDKAPREIINVDPKLVAGLRSLSYSPDGRLLSATTATGTLLIWDAATGKEQWRAEDVVEVASAPTAFSPDGRLLAAAVAGRGQAETPIRVYEIATGSIRCEFDGGAGSTRSLAFSPDGRLLASGGADTTVLLWDVTGLALDGTAPDALSDERLDALWDGLFSPRAAVAAAAISRLAAASKQTIPYLDKRIKPELRKPDAATLAALVRDLDAEDFASREKAESEFLALGKQTLPTLQDAVKGEPSLELKLRAQRLIDMLSSSTLSGEPLRLARAVEALELAHTPAAVELLEKLAKGPTGTPGTDEAAAALERLKKRAPSP